MITRVVPGLDPAALAEAAALLRAGELVAFATETVYGLGADARDDDAVAKIYAAKGRPASNPLIVHVASEAEAHGCVDGWDPRASALAARFWPGPLTLVLRRAPGLPARLSGGGDTIAVRVPAHPVARALLEAFGGPIAAPSANRSLHVSPTTAGHVAEDLEGRVALILDGGPCAVGLESTVLDLSGTPSILRPGRVRAEALRAVLGEVREGGASRPLRSPGQLERHYAPDRPLRLVAPGGRVPADVLLLGLGEGGSGLRLPSDPEGYEAALYAALRAAEAGDFREIWVESPPEGPAWTAVHDRLKRASTPA